MADRESGKGSPYDELLQSMSQPAEQAGTERDRDRDREAESEAEARGDRQQGQEYEQSSSARSPSQVQEKGHDVSGSGVSGAHSSPQAPLHHSSPSPHAVSPSHPTSSSSSSGAQPHASPSASRPASSPSPSPSPRRSPPRQPLPSAPLPPPTAGLQSFVDLGAEETDVEFVQQQLDYHWAKCKEDIMARLLSRQRRLDDEQRRLDSFRSSYVQHVEAMQDEIERLREQNAKQAREIERMRTQQKQTVATWTIQHDHVVALRLQSAAWSSWRRQFLDAQNRKKLTEKFIGPRHRKRLLLKVLSAWRHVTREARKSKDESYWRNQVQSTTSGLIKDYEKNLEELRNQLAMAEDVIRYHQQDASMMEEKLKQAFIRGVCALNREALSVFTTPAEIAEANIRSHFASVGSGSESGQASGPASLAAPLPSRPESAPPPTNPAAYVSGTSAPSASPTAAHVSHSYAAAPAPAPGSVSVSQPSAPLPSSFVGSTPSPAPTASLSSSVPRSQAQAAAVARQTGSASSLSSSVGRASSGVGAGLLPGQQLPYPPHSHAQTSRGAAPPSHRAHPHPHPHPRPHPQPHPHPHPHPAPSRNSHGTPVPRQGPPRPYGQ